MKLRSSPGEIGENDVDMLYKKPWVRFSDFYYSLEKDLGTLILQLRHPSSSTNVSMNELFLKKEQRIKSFYCLKQKEEKVYYMSGFDSISFLSKLVRNYDILLNIVFEDKMTRIKGKIDGIFYDGSI